MPRRRPILSLLLTLCTMALCASPAFARLPFGPAKHPPKKMVQEQVMDMEQQWRTATLAGDATALGKLLSDDYVGISWTGQVNTKASQLDRLRLRTLVITQMDLSDVKIKIAGTVAIVTSRAEIIGTNDGTDMKGTFLYTRIYLRQPNGTWRITNFESTRIPGPNGHPGRHHGPPPPPPTASN